MFKLNEKMENALFVFLYVIFICSVFLTSYFSNFVILYMILFYFGAACYGFISKQPIKSYIFGLFLYSVGAIAQSVLNFYLYHSTPSESVSSLMLLLIVSIICGVPGYFAAQRSVNKFKSLIFILIVVVFILIQFELTTWTV
jgi:hypothetical protein